AAADDDYFEERAKALRVLLMPRRAVYNDEWEWEKVEKEEGRGGKGWEGGGIPPKQTEMMMPWDFVPGQKQTFIWSCKPAQQA
ncbi:MAG: hypothetical protein GY739_18045, partial [Mesoflavibacter sp.]|nr:hypothetical protein [Mesoflavibacter sp.]